MGAAVWQFHPFLAHLFRLAAMLLVRQQLVSPAKSYHTAVPCASAPPSPMLGRTAVGRGDVPTGAANTEPATAPSFCRAIPRRAVVDRGAPVRSPRSRSPSA